MDRLGSCFQNQQARQSIANASRSWQAEVPRTGSCGPREQLFSLTQGAPGEILCVVEEDPGRPRPGRRGLDSGGRVAARISPSGRCPADPDGPASETITLFDGKDLKGWEGHEKYWSVVDGVILGKNTEKVPVSTYLVTKKKFNDFRLTAKVKLVDSEMHSGIAFWGRNGPRRATPTPTWATW